MRALVWHGPGQMSCDEREKPEAGSDEVLLRVRSAAICGSEVEGYLGESAIRKPPLVMGHELCCEVAATGADVAGLGVGELVAVNPLVTCGRCGACLAGRQEVCAERELLGVQRPGGFAEYVAVPATNVYPTPDGVGDVAGALVEPLACCVHATRKAGVELDDSVAVIGFGSLGVLLTQLLLRMGIDDLCVIEADPFRRDIARAIAGDKVRVEEPSVELPADLNGAFDVAFDTVGKGVTRSASVDLLRMGGTSVLLGLHDPGFPIDGNQLVRRELTITASYAYSRDSFATALGLVRMVDLDGWIRFGELEDGPESFRTLVENPTGPPKIVLRP
jgi:threonine dehydrogenase-like Zn-dependent dehydrogenase